MESWLLLALQAVLLGSWAKLKYSTILDAYSISELLELNDKTDEDCLEYLVETRYILLPEVLPIEFDE